MLRLPASKILIAAFKHILIKRGKVLPSVHRNFTPALQSHLKIRLCKILKCTLIAVRR